MALPPALGAPLQAALARGSGHGLLALGADHVGAALPPVLSYWRELGVRYVTALCALPVLGDGRAKPPVPLPAGDALQRMAADVPPMAGAEYLTVAVLADLRHRIDAAFEAEQAATRITCSRRSIASSLERLAGEAETVLANALKEIDTGRKFIRA